MFKKKKEKKKEMVFEEQYLRLFSGLHMHTYMCICAPALEHLLCTQGHACTPLHARVRTCTHEQTCTYAHMNICIYTHKTSGERLYILSSKSLSSDSIRLHPIPESGIFCWWRLDSQTPEVSSPGGLGGVCHMHRIRVPWAPTLSFL